MVGGVVIAVGGAALIPVGLGSGFLVGLTGIGGGALLTPLLVFAGIDPLSAISSDLVVSLLIKPVGGAVHARRGTVHRALVGWLSLGSIPSAFFGAYLLHLAKNSGDLRLTLKHALGGALALAVAGIVLRVVLERRGSFTTTATINTLPPVRRGPTVAVGVVGGLMVGLTSVGSGSLMIVALMLLYPKIQNATLVGTDLAQAIPLVASAALGHAFFGHIRFDIALPLLVGAIPAVYLGARCSSAGAGRWTRPVILTLLVASSIQLLSSG